jgi:hypothetical protein
MPDIMDFRTSPALIGAHGPGAIDLPRGWSVIDEEIVPTAPGMLRDYDVDIDDLADLTLRAAASAAQFNTEWMSQTIHIPQAQTGEILDRLRSELLLETLGEAGPFGYRYSVSKRGREQAERLYAVSGYIGPAPVSLAVYSATLPWQIKRCPEVTPDGVIKAFEGLDIPRDAAHLAGLAVSSGRSLFLFGPPGNGKSTLGRKMHNALQGEIWIPHALEVDGTVIRLFDPQCHEEVDDPIDQGWRIDRRWVRIRRPLVIAGGEMTLEQLDLAYHTGLRRYEAPMHLKANGGTLLIDDFGRQRVAITELLNRWIIPLETGTDFLTLQSGQKIQVPIHQRLILSTNLSPEDVTDPAFLRRMGYRLHLDKPSPSAYTRIFQSYAAGCGVKIELSQIQRLLARYEADQRELRACEPRDIIERARDICHYQGRPFVLSDEVIDLAWTGYFGETRIVAGGGH